MQARMIAAIALTIAFTGCELKADHLDDAPAAPVAVADAATLAAGKKVYQDQRCQTCHSIDNVGNRRYPLDGVGAKLSQEDIRKWIVEPKSMDPKVRKRSYDKLAAADLEALIAYLMSLK